jgi:hypothetical protein
LFFFFEFQFLMFQEESSIAPLKEKENSEEEWTGNYCEECDATWKTSDFEILDDIQLKYSTDRKRVNIIHIGNHTFDSHYSRRRRRFHFRCLLRI